MGIKEPRFTVRTMRRHGSDDDSYFNTWSEVLKFMKRQRKRSGEDRAIDFTISFKGE